MDRCPSCGAAVTAEVAWCTLCYARLAPEPEPVPVPAVEPVVGHVLVAPPVALPAAPRRPAAPAVAVPAGGPSWPCGTCGSSVPMADAVCACGTPFLAGAATGLAVPVPGVGDLTSLSRARRLGLGAVAALVLALAVLALLTGLGAVL